MINKEPLTWIVDVSGSLFDRTNVLENRIFLKKTKLYLDSQITVFRITIE